MREWRVARECERPMRYEYTYRVPLLTEVGPAPDRQTEYTDAVIGNKMDHEVKFSTRMDFLVRERMERIDDRRGILDAYHVQVWLTANQYTPAKQDMMLECFTLEHLPGLSYFDTIKDRIERIIRAECGTT